MASLGEILSSIAHQWKQPLSSISAINMNFHMLEEFSDKPSKERQELIDQLAEEVEFMSETMDDFRSFFKANDFSTWSELENKWIEYDNMLLNYVSGLTDEELNNVVEYTSLDGTVYKRQIRHILMHLTAHPNYHRGQISAIFKMKGLPSLPSTDMVVYFLDN